MVKIVFFDIDGTLINENNAMPESARQSLVLLRQKGILTGICTGRCPSELNEFLSTHKGLEFDVAVFANGALATYQGRTIVSQPLPKKELCELLTRAKQNNISYWTSGDKNWFYSVEDINSLSHILHEDELKRSDYYDPEYHMKNDVFMGEMLIDDSQLLLFSDALNELEIVPGMLVGGRFGPMMDFWRKDINKATCVIECLKELHIELEDVVAVGDSFNDIPILKSAGIGIAMGNSSDEVKQIADFVTKDIDDDGIYYALKTLNIL